MKYFIALLLTALTLSACETTGRTEKEVFTVNLRSPQISMGEIETQFDNTFPMPGIKKGTATLNYFPDEDAVCLQYRLDFMTYHQFWSRSGRAAFINALEKYKEDYENRSLNSRGGNLTKRTYGAAGGYLIWQLSIYTTQARSAVNIEIGYSFKNNAPYFTINQREGFFQDPLAERTVRETSQITMYFTRAQAEELAFFFDQQYLQGLVKGGGVVNDNYFGESETQTDDL